MAVILSLFQWPPPSFRRRRTSHGSPVERRSFYKMAQSSLAESYILLKITTKSIKLTTLSIEKILPIVIELFSTKYGPLTMWSRQQKQNCFSKKDFYSIQMAHGALERLLRSLQNNHVIKLQKVQFNTCWNQNTAVLVLLSNITK